MQVVFDDFFADSGDWPTHKKAYPSAVITRYLISPVTIGASTGFAIYTSEIYLHVGTVCIRRSKHRFDADKMPPIAFRYAVLKK